MELQSLKPFSLAYWQKIRYINTPLQRQNRSQKKMAHLIISIIWQGKQSKCGYQPNVPVAWHSSNMMYLKHIQSQGSAAGWSVQHPGVDFIIREPQEHKSWGNPRNPLLTPRHNKLHYTMNHKPMQNMPTRFHIWYHFRPSIALTSSFANDAKSSAPLCSSSVRLLILWWRKGNKRERETERMNLLFTGPMFNGMNTRIQVDSLSKHFMTKVPYQNIF